jgi:hypothetical protein
VALDQIPGIPRGATVGFAHRAELPVGRGASADSFERPTPSRVDAVSIAAHPRALEDGEPGALADDGPSAAASNGEHRRWGERAEREKPICV